jgi:outer membrane murein-binding lipoprotein Lpp
MKKAIASVLAISLALAGCATASKDIAAAYTSPMQYQNHDCEQLSAEAQRINVRVNQLAGRLDEAAANDKAIAGVGAILFWPALFALGGTKNQEAEFARLKGDHDAIQQVAVIKKCPGAMAPNQTAGIQPAISTK